MTVVQPNPPASFVYFIQHGDWGPVKIGVAADPEQRRRELQTGNPEVLHIRCLIPGDRVLESGFHRRFAEWHLQGEWFGGGEQSGAILTLALGLRDESAVLAEGLQDSIEYLGDASAPITSGERLDLRYDIERLWLRHFNAAEIAAELNYFWRLSEEDVKRELAEMRKSTVWDVGKRPRIGHPRHRNDFHVRKAA